MDKNLYIVVLAGGKGERLWPLSRSHCPKQTLSFINQRSLLEHTVDRISPLVPKKNIFIITTQEQQSLINECIGKEVGSILCEPASRNTGPAILYTCDKIYAQNQDAVILFIPSDAYIDDANAYRNYLVLAIERARDCKDIILLGVKPNWPATGYGYIEYAKSKDKICKVKHFHEKPNTEIAQMYLESDTMLWNIGNFCAKASTFLDQFKTFAPQLYADFKLFCAGKKSYEQLENISIDNAVMEKSNAVYVVPVIFGWSDVGNLDTFLSLLKLPHELHDNIIEIESKNNVALVKDKLIALIGVQDLCIVQTDDVLLVAKRKDVEKVKLVLQQLKNNKLSHYL